MNRRALTLGGGALLLVGAGGIGWTRAVGSMADYEDYVQRLRAAATPSTRDVIRYATLAANSHNTQPWRFRPATGTIDIVPDFTRRTPAVDPDDHHLFVSLGCAAENLMIAGAIWRPGEVEIAPDAALVATNLGLKHAFVNQPVEHFAEMHAPLPSDIFVPGSGVYSSTSLATSPRQLGTSH